MHTIIPFPPGRTSRGRQLAASAVQRHHAWLLARGQQPTAIKLRLRIIQAFLRDVAKPVWDITAHDYSGWITRMSCEYGLTPIKLISYHVAIASFFSALIADRQFQRQVTRLVGHRVHHPIDQRVRSLAIHPYH